VIDVYRGDAPVQKNFYKVLLYVSFFPQLIAGPIIRYTTIEKNLDLRHSSVDDIYEGFCRFAFGLAKKVIIADTFAKYSATILALDMNEMSTLVAWIGVIYYTLQIFFDFSGYSDMAIGMARMFGFHYPENFLLPYTSYSITEFWKRWHISLSSWFRDYVYIPLGGNRKGQFRTYLNLGIVFLLCGVWHGANVTFLIWGVYYGLLLIIERALKHKWGFMGLQGGAGRIATLFLVVVGWVFFMSDNITFALQYLSRMFFISQRTEFEFFSPAYYMPSNVICIIIVAILLSCFRMKKLRQWFYDSKLKAIVAILVLIYSAAFLSKSTFNPFIYFQF
jgi:alginate O-acetyltransferase complex protein AlgI